MAAKPKICQIYEKNGRLYLRDAVLAAFFLPKPLHESAEGVLAGFNIYLESIPKDALKWAGIGAGAEEWRPIDKKSFDKARAMLAPAAAMKRPMTTFEFKDGKEGDDAPEYAFSLISAKPDKEVPNEVDLVEIVFPSSVTDAGKVDGFVDGMRRIAEKLKYISGYASPALVYAETGEGRAMVESRGIAARHPGFDVQKNKLGCMELGYHVRGARWLTFLGPDLLKKLKGLKAAREVLAKVATVDEVGHGVMIRAGKMPEIGDTNKKEGTPLLRALAKVLEPVTLFNDDVLLKSYFADGNADLLTKWERRFLD